MGYKMDICQVAALRIRKMRLEKNMTIDDLAEKCDVSTQTIKLIEAGRRNFNLQQIPFVHMQIVLVAILRKYFLVVPMSLFHRLM